MLLVRVAVVALSVLTGALAGPACSQKHYGAENCISLCKHNWGWKGLKMGSDRWGSIMSTSSSSWDVILSEACGSDAATEPSATGLRGGLATATSSSDKPISTSTQAEATTSTVAESSSVASTSSFSSVAALIPTSSSSSSSLVQSTSSSVIVSEPPLPTSTFVEPETTSTKTRKTTRVSTTTQQPTTTQEPEPETTETPDPTTSEEQPAETSQSSGGSDSRTGGTSQADIDAYLKGHNDVRAQHGVDDLTWNEELATAAQEWADNCVFEHSGGKVGSFGENLAAGTGDYSIAKGIQGWTDEVSDYDASNPAASHFTQVVWKGTSEVGCAMASCAGIFDASFGNANYYVCEYSSPGNVIGQFADNVFV